MSDLKKLADQIYKAKSYEDRMKIANNNKIDVAKPQAPRNYTLESLADSVYEQNKKRSQNAPSVQQTKTSIGTFLNMKKDNMDARLEALARLQNEKSNPVTREDLLPASATNSNASMQPTGAFVRNGSRQPLVTYDAPVVNTVNNNEDLKPNLTDTVKHNDFRKMRSAIMNEETKNIQQTQSQQKDSLSTRREEAHAIDNILSNLEGAEEGLNNILNRANRTDPQGLLGMPVSMAVNPVLSNSLLNKQNGSDFEEATQYLMDTYNLSKDVAQGVAYGFNGYKDILKAEEYSNRASEYIAQYPKEVQKAMQDLIYAQSLASGVDSGLALDARNRLNSYGLPTSSDEYKQLYEYMKVKEDEKNNARWEETTAEYTKEHPVASNLASIAVSPIRGVAATGEAVRSAFYKDKEAPVNTNSPLYGLSNYSDTVRNTTHEMMSDAGVGSVGQFMYDVGVSTAESGLSMAVGGSVAGALGKTGKAAEGIAQLVTLPSFGANAFAQTLKEQQEKGFTKEDSMKTAFYAGAAEMAFEAISLDKAWSAYEAGKIGKKSLKDRILNAFAGSLIEGSEEVFTDISNTITDYLVNGNYSDFKQEEGMYGKSEAYKNLAVSLGKSFLAGAISGGITNAVTFGIGEMSATRTAEDVIQNKEMTQAYIDNAKNNMPKDSTAYKIAKTTDAESITTSQLKEIMISTQEVDASHREIANKQMEEAEARHDEDVKNNLINAITVNAETGRNLEDIKSVDITEDGVIVKTSDGDVKVNEFVGKDQTTNRVLYDAVRINQTLGIKTDSKALINAYVDNYTGSITPEQYKRAFVSTVSNAINDISFDKVDGYTRDIISKLSPSTYNAIKMIASTYAKKEQTFNTTGANVNVVKSLSNALGMKVEVRDLTGTESETSNGFYDPNTDTIVISSKSSNPAAVVFSHEFVHNLKKNDAESYAVLNEKGAEWAKVALTEAEYSSVMKKYTGESGSYVDQVVRWRSEGKSEEDIRSLIDEEINAHMTEAVMEKMATMSDKELQRFAEKTVSMDKTFGQKFLDAIKKFVENIKNALHGYKATSAEAKFLLSDEKQLYRFMEAFQNAIAKNTQYSSLAELSEGISDAVTESGIVVDTDTDTVMHSQRTRLSETWESLGFKSYEEAVDIVAKEINEKSNIGDLEKVKRWILSEESIASMILADEEHMRYLDYIEDDRYVAVKKNADYKQGTVDLSNLCRKREIFTRMFDNLQKKNPDTLFTAEDIAAIRQVLVESNYETACALCYVEDRRQQVGEIADAFIGFYENALNSNDKKIYKENWEGVNKPLKATKAQIKKFGLEQRKGDNAVYLYADDPYIPTQYDLTTYDGFKNLVNEHPSVALAFENYNNSRGMASARLIEGHAEYKRDILKWSDKRVQMVNNAGGLRVFSFSDFEAIHLIDIVQVVMDCAARGVKIQTYTKVPSFANIARDTGAKINRSLIPANKGSKNAYALVSRENGGYKFEKVTPYENGIAKLNGSDVLAFDIVEGIDVTDENFFDCTDNHDVGNICIGINDEQVRYAMVDDFVDYIIPFHTGQKAGVLHTKGIHEWVNYKDSQEDKKIAGVSKKKRINIYTDVLNNKKYNVQNKVDFVNAFLDVCKTYGFVPRFEQFLNKNEDGDYIYTEGYHKFLIDYKLFDTEGNILPQEVVRPDFDLELVNEILEKDMARSKNMKFSDDVMKKVTERLAENGKDIMYSQKDTGDNSQFNTENHGFNMESILKEGLEALKKYPSEGIDTYKIADQILKETYSTYDRNLLKRNLDSLFAYIRKNKGQKINFNDLSRVAYEIAMPVAGGMNLDRNDSVQNKAYDIALRIYSKYFYALGNKNASYKLNQMIQKVSEQYEERIRRSAERRENAETRQSILHKRDRLNRMLTNPTKGSHIPRELVLACVDIADLINEDTSQKGYKAIDKIENVKKAYEELRDNDWYSAVRDEQVQTWIDELNQAIKQRSINNLNKQELEKVNTVLNAVLTMVKNQNQFISTQRSETIAEARQKAIEEVNASKGYKDSKLLSRANNMYQSIALNAERLLNRVFGYVNGSEGQFISKTLRNAEIQSIADRFEAESIFNELMSGKEGKANILKFQGKNSKGNIDESTFVEIPRTGIKAPASLIASMVMHMQNEDNLRHIAYGGFRLPNMEEYKRGNISEAYSRGTTIDLGLLTGEDIEEAKKRSDAFGEYVDNEDGSRVYFKENESNPLVKAYLNAKKAAEEASYKDRARLIEARDKAWRAYQDARREADTYLDKLLKERAKEYVAEINLDSFSSDFVDALKKFFWEFSGNKINETTRRMYGYDKATVKNYYPIKVDASTIGGDQTAIKMDGTLEGAGYLKERVKSKKPILLEDATQVVNRHIKQISQFHGFAEAIRDVNALLNYSEGNVSLRGVINQKWGDRTGAGGQINQILQDIQTSRPNAGVFDGAFSKLRSNFAGATLTGNFGVMIKQAASLPTASAEVGWKAIGSSLAHFATAKPITEIESRTPLMHYRELGYSTQEMGDLKDLGRESFLEKTAPWFTGMIQWMDVKTVRSLEYAAKAYIDENTYLEEGTDEYWNAVTDKFNDIVLRTQPNYTTLERPELLKNQNQMLRTLFMFKTQPMQNYGILVDAINDYRANKTEESKKRMANAISSNIVSALTYSMMTIVAKLAYHADDFIGDGDDEDDKEIKIGKMLSTLISTFLSSEAGMLLGGSEIYSYIASKVTGEKNYGVADSTVSMINDVTDGLDNLTSSIEKLSDATTEADRNKYAKNVAYRTRTFAASLASMAGIPFNNIYKPINSMISYAVDLANGWDGEWFEGVATYSAVKSSPNQYKLIYEALVDGDMERFDKLWNEQAEKLSSGDPSSGVTSIVKEQYLNGNIDAETVDRYFESAGKNNQRDKWDYMEETGSDSYSVYSRLTDAIDEGDFTKAKEEVKKLRDSGKDDGAIKSAITSKYKSQYLELLNTNKSEASKLKNALINAYVLAGDSREAAQKKIEAWK